MKGRLPPDAVNCLLGVKFSSQDHKCDKDPVLQANWILWSDGEIIKRGSTYNPGTSGRWAYDSVDRILEAFRGDRKKKYNLEVNFTKDGRALDVADPHLIMQLSND